MDRIADGAVFGAVAYWLAGQGNHAGVAAALICLVAGGVVSYVKARAEGLGMTANVGIAERTERLLIVGVGGLLTGFGVEPALPIALWMLAAVVDLHGRPADGARLPSGERRRGGAVSGQRDGQPR